MGEQICLKWNSFHSNFISNFKSLWEEEGLYDITLASDGQCIGAHKLILSACSPFFKTIIKANPSPHPVLIMQDIGFSEVNSLLTFMYYGEVLLQTDALPAFLKAAKTLQVRGLEGAEDKLSHRVPRSKTTLVEESSQDLPAAKRRRKPTTLHSSPLLSMPLLDTNATTPTVSMPTTPTTPRDTIPTTPTSPTTPRTSTPRTSHSCHTYAESSPSGGSQEEPGCSNHDTTPISFSESLLARDLDCEVIEAARQSDAHIDQLPETNTGDQQVMPGEFCAGTSYPNWQQAEAAFAKWSDSGHHPMKVNKSLLNPKPSKEYPYKRVLYTCKHHGKPRQRGKNIRPRQHHNAQECPVRVKINLLSSTNTYIVRQLASEHNHPVNAELRAQYPDKRLPNDKERAMIAQMVRRNVNMSVIKQYVRERMGKPLNGKDLYNIKHNFKTRVKRDEEDLSVLGVEAEYDVVDSEV